MPNAWTGTENGHARIEVHKMPFYIFATNLAFFSAFFLLLLDLGRAKSTSVAGRMYAAFPWRRRRSSSHRVAETQPGVYPNGQSWLDLLVDVTGVASKETAKIIPRIHLTYGNGFQ